MCLLQEEMLKEGKVQSSKLAARKGQVKDDPQLAGEETHGCIIMISKGEYSRNGQLKPLAIEENPFLAPGEDLPKTVLPWKPSIYEDQKTWTVFDKEPSYLSIASRNYTHTRLW
ncbi:hypothetical protein MAR_033957 [Mya arenaria]|uniref:Uncharacterized protein n=1 Tax=Mya arenaria TaxID=6604 RepID=A0ABY7GAH2_MYAAR|nr:hypothetical protein MAR_033957 [Mya arenaria]